MFLFPSFLEEEEEVEKYKKHICMYKALLSSLTSLVVDQSLKDKRVEREYLMKKKKNGLIKLLFLF